MKLPELHHFEAETRFIDAFQILKRKLKDLPDAEEKVGAFWDKDWVRAPFEEELTLRQLASLSTEILIKKKSFTADKMTALSYALEKAVSAPTSSTAHSKSIPAAVNQDSVRSITPYSFLSLDGATADEAIYFLGLQTASRDIFSQQESYSRFMSEVFSAVAAGTLVNPWSNAKKAPTKTQSEKANAFILNIASMHIPEVLLHLRTALTGPGSAIAVILSPYGLPEKDFVIGEKLLLPLLHALGASIIRIEKKEIPGHYSTHPDTAGTIFKALKGKSLKDKTKFIDTFSLPFPFFDLEIVWKAIRASV